MSALKRHPDVLESFDPGAIPKRVVNLDAAYEKFGDSVDQYTPFLMQGDPLMDELINELELYLQNPGRVASFLIKH